MGEQSWLREEWPGQGLTRVGGLRPPCSSHCDTWRHSPRPFSHQWVIIFVFLNESASPELALSIGAKWVEFSCASVRTVDSEVKRQPGCDILKARGYEWVLGCPVPLETSKQASSWLLGGHWLQLPCPLGVQDGVAAPVQGGPACRLLCGDFHLRGQKAVGG